MFIFLAQTNLILNLPNNHILTHLTHSNNMVTITLLSAYTSMVYIAKTFLLAIIV